MPTKIMHITPVIKTIFRLELHTLSGHSFCVDFSLAKTGSFF